MINAADAGTKPVRAGRLKRLVRSLGAVTGLLSASLGAGAVPAVAQDNGYRSAATVPASWQEFSRRLQGRLEQRLSADDETARRFQDYMAARARVAGAPVTMIVRAWVLSSGEVERVEIDGLKDAPVNLQALLALDDVGAPPEDMLQPLHLRLSLRPRDDAGRGG
jgi:hypothetical protein